MITDIRYAALFEHVTLGGRVTQYPCLGPRVNPEDDYIDWMQGTVLGLRIKHRSGIALVPWSNVRYAEEQLLP